MQHNKKTQKPIDNGLNQKPYHDAVFSSPGSFDEPISSPGPESYKKKEEPNIVKDPNNSAIYAESEIYQSNIFGSAIEPEEMEEVGEDVNSARYKPATSSFLESPFSKKTEYSEISAKEYDLNNTMKHKSNSSLFSENLFLKKEKKEKEEDNQSEYSVSSKYSTASKKGIEHTLQSSIARKKKS